MMSSECVCFPLEGVAAITRPRYRINMSEGNGITIYVAAALFSGRETGFNVRLSTALEERGYETILPQRDGFEFGELGRQLAHFVSKEKVHETVQTIIYVLDVGHFIPRSKLVVASLDEPLDDGVLVEISDARRRGIPVIGFRTDVRTPYGGPTDELGGIHFFPAFQCDIFFRHRMASRSADETETDWRQFMVLIERSIQSALALDSSKRVQMPAQVDLLAQNLFSGLDNLHSEASLTTIAMRCRDLQAELAQIRPQVIAPLAP